VPVESGPATYSNNLKTVLNQSYNLAKRGLKFPIITMTPLSKPRNPELYENFEQVIDSKGYPLLNNKK